MSVSVASVPSVSNDVVSNVTCSLCENLFDDPKMMPGCLHTFCLNCLKQIPVEKKPYFWKVKCPECKTESKLNGPESERDVQNFKTNIVAQNVVSAIKAQGETTSEACLHIGEKEHCVSCNRDFCRPCRLAHMEEMKIEALDFCKEALDVDLIESAKDTLARIDTFVESEARKVSQQMDIVSDTLKSAFESALDAQVDILKMRLTKMKNEQIATLKAATHLLADRERIDELKKSSDLLAKASVLKLQLPDVANFYLDIIERRRTASYIEQILKLEPTTLFKFELDEEVENFIASFEGVNFGSLQLNQKAEMAKAFFNKVTAGVEIPDEPEIEPNIPTPPAEEDDQLKPEKKRKRLVADDDMQIDLTADEPQSKVKETKQPPKASEVDKVEMKTSSDVVEKDDEIKPKKTQRETRRKRIVSDSDDDVVMKSADGSDAEEHISLPSGSEEEEEEEASDEEESTSEEESEASDKEESSANGSNLLDDECEDEEAEEEEENGDGFIEDDLDASSESSGPSGSSDSSQAMEVNDEQDEVVIDSVLKETKRVVIKDTNAIIALPSKNAFGVMHENKTFTLIQPTTGRVVKNYAIAFPIAIESIDIFEMATDDRDCVVLTAEVGTVEKKPKSGEGDALEDVEETVISRRLYRFWMTDKNEVNLMLFAKAKDAEDFNGLAVSKTWGYVFTTEGDNVVGFASIGIGRSQRATRVFKCNVGLDPFVHSIAQPSDDLVHLICSSEFRIVDKVIGMNDEGRLRHKKDKRWRHVEVEDLKSVWPGLIAVWGDNAVVSKGYWLKRFCSFPDNAQSVGSFAPAYSSHQPLESYKSLAVMHISNFGCLPRDFVALINESDTVTIAVLPKDGCCLNVVE